MIGKWRIIKMPDYTADYPDMVEPAYIQFDHEGGGEFAFGCVTGRIYGSPQGFRWIGNAEMDEASGEGWAELQPDGLLNGQICFDNGDEADFVAKATSSTAC